jgi:hypothetical protein
MPGGVCGVGVAQNEHTRQGRLAGSPTPQRTFDHRVIFEVVIRKGPLSTPGSGMCCCIMSSVETRGWSISTLKYSTGVLFRLINFWNSVVIFYFYAKSKADIDHRTETDSAMHFEYDDTTVGSDANTKSV